MTHLIFRLRKAWGGFPRGYNLSGRGLLERTRGAGAPEVLRRETAEEEFRLRRNQPLMMASSAPKDRYYQADFFAQLFQKKIYFFWSRQMLYRSLF